ncbi:MAG: hypothetical protein M3Q10_13145 [Chloroflexota bacterium]|nr:hypothetical protein [Chloroflexota bacterium]
MLQFIETPGYEGRRSNHVFFPPGWRQDDSGVWVLSNHAVARFRRDRWIASGNGLTPASEAVKARRRLSEGKTLAFRRGAVDYYGADRGQVPHASFLPTIAQCPKCQATNRLELRLMRWLNSESEA